MQILASKFIYLEEQKNLTEVLKPFKNMAVQLAFFHRRDFLQMNHKHIREVCTSLNIDIPTVHAPTVDVFNEEFLEIIGRIRDIYDVKVISIHPQKGDIGMALAKLEEYATELEDFTLAYENFPSPSGKRKWIHLPSEMYQKFELPFLKLTFDTSHLDNPDDCIEEFGGVSDKVAVVHLSDYNKGKQHQPLGAGCVPYEKFVRHLKEMNFLGFVVLEYMEEFEGRLIDDVRKFAYLLDIM